MREILVRAQAGGRIDLAGGWGDGCTIIDPEGSKGHVLGRVCNIGLEIGAKVEIKSVPQKGIRVICNGFNQVINEQSKYGQGLDLFVAAIRRFDDLSDNNFGWEIRACSQIPYGSGLGGSAAMAVPLVASILYALDLDEPWRQQTEENHRLPYAARDFIASEARALEIEEIKMSSGWQDQWAAAFGGVNFLRAERDPQKPIRYPILSDHKQIKMLQEHLMLVCVSKDKGVKRSSSEQHKKANEAQRFELLEIIAQQGVAAKDAVKSLNFRQLGQVVSQAWETIKIFTNGAATSDKIDWLIDEAHRCGAWGAKACGAGGSGACVAIVADRETQVLLRQVLAYYPDYQILPAKISQTGLTVERVL